MVPGPPSASPEGLARSLFLHCGAPWIEEILVKRPGRVSHDVGRRDEPPE